MPLSAFIDKSHSPTADELRTVLGGMFESWTRLLALVAEQIGPITEVWGFTSKSTGWGLRVRHKERVILYMTPQSEQFLVSIVLGEKAVVATRAVKLPQNIRKAIDEAPRYAEGRGFRVEVKNSRPLVALATLAHIKWQS